MQAQATGARKTLVYVAKVWMDTSLAITHRIHLITLAAGGETNTPISSPAGEAEIHILARNEQLDAHTHGGKPHAA